MIEFKNGSKIKCILTSNNVRGKRSKLKGYKAGNFCLLPLLYPIFI